MKYAYSDLAGMIDHALLQPTMTDREMEEGCALAAQYKVASVCVKPYYVKRAAELLKQSGVKVGTVIGFPHGSNATEVKRYETEVACKDGAVEIDMVINIGRALSGDWGFVENDIRAVCEEAARHRAIVKVIIETDYLPNDEIKARLCRICEKAGADFVKTSTGYGFVKQATGGFSYKGATKHDLILMRRECSPKVRIKASGGVRDLDGLIMVRELGAARCGTSSTVAILEEYLEREKAGKAGEHVDARPGEIGGGGY